MEVEIMNQAAVDNLNMELQRNDVTLASLAERINAPVMVTTGNPMSIVGWAGGIVQRDGALYATIEPEEGQSLPASVKVATDLAILDNGDPTICMLHVRDAGGSFNLEVVG